MPSSRRPDQVLVGAYLDQDLAHAFEAWSRAKGGKSAALRGLIREAVGTPSPNPRQPIAEVVDLHVRLTDREREAVRQAAAEQGMLPSTWVRSLVRAHVLRRPQWGVFERQGFAAVLTALGKIGSNVNQMARAMNVAVLKGEYPAGQGAEAREAAAEVQRTISQLGEMVDRNLSYWGSGAQMKAPARQTRRKPVA